MGDIGAVDVIEVDSMSRASEIKADSARRAEAGVDSACLFPAIGEVNSPNRYPHPPEITQVELRGPHIIAVAI